jgi:cytidylate kinase
MAAWLIRVVGTQREKIDAYLVAQAVIAYARRLREREKAERQQAARKSTEREVSP